MPSGPVSIPGAHTGTGSNSPGDGSPRGPSRRSAHIPPSKCDADQVGEKVISERPLARSPGAGARVAVPASSQTGRMTAHHVREDLKPAVCDEVIVHGRRSTPSWALLVDQLCHLQLERRARCVLVSSATFSEVRWRDAGPISSSRYAKRVRVEADGSCRSSARSPTRRYLSATTAR